VNHLAVLYDDGCPFCRRCRDYLERQPQLVPLRLVPMATPAARALTGGAIPAAGRELVVVADDGAFWVGGDAFLMCMWALEEQRALAMAFAHPWLRPWSELFFDSLSSGRHFLSSLFGGGERCEGGHCGVAQNAYR
jgi:predicted DCC family thiol-disulfide oxidoreductase YuxK